MDHAPPTTMRCDARAACITCRHGPDSRVPCCHSADCCADSSIHSTAGAGPSRSTVARPGSPCFHPFQYLFSYSSVLLLLSSSLLPAMSAPTTRKSQWKNPCAIDQSLLLEGAGDMNMPASSDAEIMDRIIHLNRVVRPKVDELMDQFVRSTYHTDETEMLRDWGHHNMSWLGFVRDTIDRVEAQLASQDAADGGADGVTLAATLRTYFADLQRLAIGFEQMTLDAALHGDPNLDAFRRLQADLMQLLCELQIALLEKRLTADSSVTADIMGQEVRDLDSSRERNLRNWVIIREYKMYLAHLDKVFNALRRRIADQ